MKEIRVSSTQLALNATKRVPWSSSLKHVSRDALQFADEIIASMQPADLMTAIRGPGSRNEVNLSMPKFKIEYTYDRVKNDLKQCGVNKIFVPGVGDFGDLFLNVSIRPSYPFCVMKLGYFDDFHRCFHRKERCN